MLNMLWEIHWNLSKTREFPAIHNFIARLKEERNLSSEDWQQLCNERLRKLLVFAGKNIDYYRGVFEKSGFHPAKAELPHDMKKIPILTKDIIRGNLRRLLSDTVDKSSLVENATGGSTGTPLKFYQDLKYRTIATAIDVYARQCWGIKPYDRTAQIWGADIDFHEMTLKERLYEIRQRTKALNAFRMSNEDLLNFCLMLRKWRPPYLMGYSSALEELAKCARRNKIEGLTFKAIRSTAETLWPHQRKLIEETFNSPVFDFYGSREVNNMAAECPEGRKLHLISTWRYIEITDENGKPVPAGEPGYITVTDLSNFAMPFIRYRNEDIGRFDPEKCECGRPTPVLKELLGRSTDIIRTSKGNIVHGEFFTHLFYGCDEIKQFQVHQTALDQIVVRYVSTGVSLNQFIEEIAEKIKVRLGQDITVEIEKCDEIPVSASSGKHRFTISDVK